MNTISKFMRSVVFILILGFVSVSTYNVLSWKDSMGILALYNSQPNSTDVLFFGSSHSFCTINTAMLWEEYGIASNDYSEKGQVFANEYNFMIEALKTQRPKVVFAELFGISMPYTVGNVYRNSLNMKWSRNYFNNLDTAISVLDETAQQSEDIDKIKKSISLKFPVIHSRYNELSVDDFQPSDKGNLLRFSPNWSKKGYNEPRSLSNTTIAELSESQIQSLDQMVALSEEYGFKLVLWVAPYVVGDERIQQFNAVEQYAAEKGIDYYGIRKIIKETGFDFKKDMRSETNWGSHMNCYGAEKVTRYIGDLLINKYNIQDHRNDPYYSRIFEKISREWDVEYAAHNLDTAKNLQDYASALDHSLFDATVINYGNIADKAQNNALTSDSTDIQSADVTSKTNLIENADSYTDWFKVKEEYISYPEPGIVKFSASGLTELSYSRVEGPILLETESFTQGDEYVLSFEVMSPNWTAVYEPTTDYTGLDAVAITFGTTDDLPLGKQKAYRSMRLGESQSWLWKEIPAAKNGDWLQFVSVPLRFTSTKDTWSDIDKEGLGKYLRVGPSLRANGTVYFRNFRLEKCSESNDWEAVSAYISRSISKTEGDMGGLYTNATRNRVNGAWELSDQVKLLYDENNSSQIQLFNGAAQQQINDCDLCVIVVDKEDGSLIKKNEFTLTNGIFKKN